MNNKYLFHSKISEAQFRVILRMFCEDRILDEIQERVIISRPTLTRILRLLRERIVEMSELEAKCSGEVEVDKSYFEPRRVRGKRGRGAGHKVPVV
jgi:transposase